MSDLFFAHDVHPSICLTLPVVNLYLIGLVLTFENLADCYPDMVVV
jgi:hypothetical protein